MSKSDIIEFDKQLRDVWRSPNGWPFVCNGSPFDCQLFLVGINPATCTPFWPFWSLEQGFDKAAWLDEYRARRSQLTPTRWRIERFCDAVSPIRVLETNIFHHSTRRAADLKPSQQSTEVFEFLLGELQPTLIFVHGKRAIRDLERLTASSLIAGQIRSGHYRGQEIFLACGPHLYNWSYLQVERMGAELRAHCLKLDRTRKTRERYDCGTESTDV
jgi:hypothetical protein